MLRHNGYQVAIDCNDLGLQILQIANANFDIISHGKRMRRLWILSARDSQLDVDFYRKINNNADTIIANSNLKCPLPSGCSSNRSNSANVGFTPSDRMAEMMKFLYKNPLRE